MKFLSRIFNAFLCLLLPKSLYEAVGARIIGIKNAFTSNLELRIFWKVVFFPIVLPLSLLIALLKSVCILISPAGYRYTKFIVNQFCSDIAHNHITIKKAIKRARLTGELFIKGRERHVSFGEKNPDKVFYVIRPYYYLTLNELATSLSDLLFHYYRNLQQLSYAVNRGWIPVVDWENYVPLRHMEDYPVNGTVNGWEYYWRQPSEYTLDEVYSSKNVVLANRNSVDYGFIPSPFLKPPFKSYAKSLAEKCPEYDCLFQLNDITRQYVDKWHKELFPAKERVLGVSIRGASYGRHPVPGHPKQPGIQRVVFLVRECIKKYEINYVFFACESEDYVNVMREEFGDKLIVLPRERMTREPKIGETNPLYYPGRRYQTNLDYLTEMMLLSRCTALMAGMSSGTRSAIIWNANKYEFVEILDEGLW